jgi:hypothetical protein
MDFHASRSTFKRTGIMRQRHENAVAFEGGGLRFVSETKRNPIVAIFVKTI